MPSIPRLFVNVLLPRASIKGFAQAVLEYTPLITGLQDPVESAGGLLVLTKAIKTFAPQLHDIADAVRHSVASSAGAVVIQGLNFAHIARQCATSRGTQMATADTARLELALILGLAVTIGVPTNHCADKRLVWPVQFRPVAAGTTPTFSQRLGRTPLHTDSSFDQFPELYNFLYANRQARCGGGASVIVNGSAFLDDFFKTLHGADCIRFMRGADYAFRVPDAFFRGDRLFTGKIIADDPLIRFRPDAIESGFDLCPELATKEHRFYYALFRNAVEAHTKSRAEFLLSDGELLVLDNKRLLHARTSYTDPSRLLFRVRMREREHHIPAAFQ